VNERERDKENEHELVNITQERGGNETIRLIVVVDSKLDEYRYKIIRMDAHHPPRRPLPVK
jgi:hypothetical protein